MNKKFQLLLTTTLTITVQKKSHLEYLLDILVFGEIEEKALLVMEYGKEVTLLEQRISKFTCREAETSIGSSQ